MQLAAMSRVKEDYAQRTALERLLALNSLDSLAVETDHASLSNVCVDSDTPTHV